MSVVIITGSCGLIGSEAVEFFAQQGLDVIGIDNDMRRYFFGAEASTSWRKQELELRYPQRYEHKNMDIRDFEAIRQIFQHYGRNIRLVIHTAAQPSHDWAAQEPLTDFSINAMGTLHLLEATRLFAPEAVFIFTSTNKVYGDLPNGLPLVEKDTRWEIEPSHPYHQGIPEEMSIDHSLHSVFGASKVAADVMVQEYGRYFGMYTACLRGGCLTGPHHSGAQLHGFLAFLMKCAATGAAYTVFGYRAKQVRDNIHSSDLIEAINHIYQAPRIAEVYNMGGGRHSHCSMLEAIEMCENIVGREMNWQYSDHARKGDHIWYVSSLQKFESHYPSWKQKYDVPTLLQEIYDMNRKRWGIA